MSEWSEFQKSEFGELPDHQPWSSGRGLWLPLIEFQKRGTISDFRAFRSKGVPTVGGFKTCSADYILLRPKNDQSFPLLNLEYRPEIFFFLFMATPTAYESSWATGLIAAASDAYVTAIAALDPSCL